MSNCSVALPTLFPDQRCIWLNAAHQGMLPLKAVGAAVDALSMKIDLQRMASLDVFYDVPEKLRARLASFFAVSPDEIFLTNSTSDAMQQIADGIPWNTGDEILCFENEFPATVLPFQRLLHRGLRMTTIGKRSDGIDLDSVSRSITKATRAVLVTLVDPFSGDLAPYRALSTVCREANVLLIANASQAAGAVPVDFQCFDALAACGFKWLCGPYATGFGWIRDSVQEVVLPSRSNWLLLKSSLETTGESEAKWAKSIRDHDRFTTADFMNNLPWIAAIETLMDIGINRIVQHNHALIDEFLSSVDNEIYSTSTNRIDEQSWSAIQFVSHRDQRLNRAIHRALEKENIFVGYRNGQLRISPHIFNQRDNISALVDRLNGFHSTADVHDLANHAVGKHS